MNGGYEQVKTAIKEFITRGNPRYFTNQMMSREGIKKSLSQEDMLDLIVEQYVTQITSKQNQRKNCLDMSIIETIKKYDNEQASFALKRYITEGNVNGFTSQNNARRNIRNNMTADNVLDKIIEDYILVEIEKIKQAMNIEKSNEKSIKGMYFNASEFAQVALPQEKKHIISKAATWIKERKNNRDNINSEIKDIKTEEKER